MAIMRVYADAVLRIADDQLQQTIAESRQILDNFLAKFNSDPAIVNEALDIIYALQTAAQGVGNSELEQIAASIDYYLRSFLKPEGESVDPMQAEQLYNAIADLIGRAERTYQTGQQQTGWE